jgi:carbonic anhydrase
MEKVFHFDSPRDKYRCDAAVVWCFDSRFHLVMNKFLKRLGIEYSDPIEIAGGAKSLASPDHDLDREFVLEQVQDSIRLHGTKLVILMVHSDCGAYGGLAAFGGDAKVEAQRQEAQLRLAAETLLKAVPGITVQAYFVDFEGVWRVELMAADERR